MTVSELKSGHKSDVSSGGKDIQETMEGPVITMMEKDAPVYHYESKPNENLD